MSEPPEIHIAEADPVNVEAVMRQIRAHIVARRNLTGATPAVVLPSFEGRLDAAIYEQLYHAALIHDQLSLSINVIPSHMPLVGQFVTFFRRKFHELVTYYVNQLAQKQIMFNRHILGAVNGLVQEVERLSPTELEGVRRDSEAVRQQVTARDEHR
jgi:hypothetical protein